jgi:peptidoglycan hydrolase-like protein with peptidoglycan-binding domain
MPLVSNLFKDNDALQACLVLDSKHVVPGSFGEHVKLIQIALQDLDNLKIDPVELADKRYGPSTATAVLAFKKKRRIINYAYQETEDNIVGKMTISRMDQEMHDRQYIPRSVSRVCLRRVPAINPTGGERLRRR